MEIKNWLVTGDTHGYVAERLERIGRYKPNKTAVIILGDVGLNFYLNTSDRDKIEKQRVQDMGYRVYCVRGNHEERPENIPSMLTMHDTDVNGRVFYEPEYPNIRYFYDGDTYEIHGYKVLVIGGAYSVDKWCRISYAHGEDFWTGWFKEEQLSHEEMANIMQKIKGEKYDFVFTHTCPFDWQPTDLFLSGFNQYTVDNSMELWLNEVKNEVSWGVWLFGHYHEDRLERPYVEMFYENFDLLDNIWERWYSSNEEPPYWIYRSPNYEKGI